MVVVQHPTVSPDFPHNPVALVVVVPSMSSAAVAAAAVAAAAVMAAVLEIIVHQPIGGRKRLAHVLQNISVLGGENSWA